MRATINGIVVEGTPQEIADYQKRMDEMRRSGVHIKPPLGATPDWMKRDITIKCETISRCPNEGSPCYCTGACK